MITDDLCIVNCYTGIDCEKEDSGPLCIFFFFIIK